MPEDIDVQPRVLFVVNLHDQMTQQYRVTNHLPYLESAGFHCQVVNDLQVELLAQANADLLVLNRIACSVEIEELINRFRAAEKTVIYDIDDLIFDPSQFELLSFCRSWTEPEKQVLKDGMGAFQKTLKLCDIATVTTHALRLEVERMGIPSYIVPNTIQNGLSQFCETQTRQESAVRIGYMSGTRTHEEDFNECEDALVRLLGENENAVLVIVGELDLPACFQGLEERIEQLPLMSHNDMLGVIAGIDINIAPLELSNKFKDCKSELKIFEAAHYSVPTVASSTSTFSSVIENGKDGFLARNQEEWYTYLSLMTRNAVLRKSLGAEAKSKIARRYQIENVSQELVSLYQAILKCTLRHNDVFRYEKEIIAVRPLISVVTVLYNKAREVRYFLEALRRQNFIYPFEVILVNDQTPDDSVKVVDDYANRIKEFIHTTPMNIKVIHNETNIGNCGSRNAGIAQAKGQVIVVVDADCMFNASFLSDHYAAHAKGDCDVAIGPINIETHDCPAFCTLGQFETDVLRAENESIPQDGVNRDSFVNCITRNFSIGSEFLQNKIDTALFDEDFTYSADPDSGFGWEDVEMGVRIYLSQGRIKYLQQAVSVHISHPSSSNENQKPFRSLKNFRRLFEKHPSLLKLSRKWSMETYRAIVDWCLSVDCTLQLNEDYIWLESRFSRYEKMSFSTRSERPLKILTHRWHVPHQYELYRIGHEFSLVTGLTGLCDSWEFEKRPLPKNMKFVKHADVKISDYDLAILHFDENVLHPELCNGQVPEDWGETFNWLLSECASIPTIGICHGTPQFVGQYQVDYNSPDAGSVIDVHRRELVNYLSELTVITNSYQAQDEWQFKKGHTIWHGFSPHDYSPGTRENGVLVMMERALKQRPRYNGLAEHRKIEELLAGNIALETLRTPDPSDAYQFNTNDWSISKYQIYSREVGSFSIYLNTTLRSPMPRSRGEAMMAGLVPVCINNHDCDLFLVNGINGFFGDSAEELAEYLTWLHDHPKAKIKMGDKARETALDIFNQDRYLSDWSNLISKVLG